MEFFRWLFGLKRSSNAVSKEKTVNVLMMGKAAVGKSALVRKLVDDETYVAEHLPTLYDSSEKEVSSVNSVLLMKVPSSSSFFPFSKFLMPGDISGIFQKCWKSSQGGFHALFVP